MTGNFFRRPGGLPPNSVVRIGALRKSSAPYMVAVVFYYAWVIAFATWWNASPFPGDIFDADLRSLMHAVNLFSSALFIFLIRKENFVRSARAGAVLIFAGMGLCFAAPGTFLRLFGAAAASAAVGCVNISVLIPFVFTLNNTEKLYTMVGSNALIQLILLILPFQERSVSGSRSEFFLSFTLLAAALGSIWFFRPGDAEALKSPPADAPPAFPPRIYLTIAFNCAVAAVCKGAGKGILNVTALSSPMGVLTWYYAGGLAGCALFLFVYAFSGKAFLWLGNITFASVAMGLLCNAFSGDVPGLAAAFAFLLGLGNAVGMIHMYYIVGVIGKKYHSMRYLRLSVPLIGLCGGIAGIAAGNFISRTGTLRLSMAASLISAAVVLFCLAFSPLLAQARFENDWPRDAQNSEIDNGQSYLFEKYNLTRRETEVCRLLLQGCTLRQISAVLSISYSTVNTYCTSVYRKLEINSRAELLLLFRDYAPK